MATSPVPEALPISAPGRAYERRSLWSSLRQSLTPTGSGLQLGAWRELAGPSLFWLAAVAMLVYDHVQDRVSTVVFLLTLILVATIFVWLVLSNRRRAELIEYQRLSAMRDSVTGLYNRSQLEADVANVLAHPAGGQVLMLVELDGLQAQHERFGYAVGDVVLGRAAVRLSNAVAPLGGQAYRGDGSQFAVLVPATDQQFGEIVIAATTSLVEGETDLAIEAVHGEVALPDEAMEPGQAFQIASQRLATRRQRQRRSASRQAHAALLAVLSARRPELRDHLRDLTERVLAVGRWLKVEDDQLDDIVRAAQLQDIGLLSVPEAILEKKRPLTDEERALILAHPIAGADIVNAAPGLAPVASLVRASCERFDGSGYPDGLAGDAIPLGARIIAVCVAFAAMTSPRPYRAAPIHAWQAVEELRRDAGTQFDPAVVDALAQDLAATE